MSGTSVRFSDETGRSSRSTRRLRLDRSVLRDHIHDGWVGRNCGEVDSGAPRHGRGDRRRFGADHRSSELSAARRRKSCARLRARPSQARMGARRCPEHLAATDRVPPRVVVIERLGARAPQGRGHPRGCASCVDVASGRAHSEWGRKADVRGTRALRTPGSQSRRAIEGRREWLIGIREVRGGLASG
jgi:hypothetical protein